MRSRASVYGSVGESVDIYSIMPAVNGAWKSTRDGFVPQLAAKRSEIDADLYLFALCKHLQTIYLDRRGIGCILDADGVGRLPETVCRMLGLMVRELVSDVADCYYPDTSQESIKVTLRRRGTTYLCAVSRRCSGSCACARRGLRRVRQLASQLSDHYVVRSTPDRGITAILFDIDLVERSFPNANVSGATGIAASRTTLHCRAGLGAMPNGTTLVKTLADNASSTAYGVFVLIAQALLTAAGPLASAKDTAPSLMLSVFAWLVKQDWI